MIPCKKLVVNMTTKPSEFLINFGKRLKRIRRQQNLTQGELAAISSIHINTIIRIECKYLDISLSTFEKLCKALKVSFAQLLEDSPKQEENLAFCKLKDEIYNLQQQCEILFGTLKDSNNDTKG